MAALEARRPETKEAKSCMGPSEAFQPLEGCSRANRHKSYMLAASCCQCDDGVSGGDWLGMCVIA